MDKKNNTVILVIVAILAVGLICILGWMLFNTLFGEEQAPVVTPLPVRDASIVAGCR